MLSHPVAASSHLWPLADCTTPPLGHSEVLYSSRPLHSFSLSGPPCTHFSPANFYSAFSDTPLNTLEASLCLHSP